MSNPSPQASGDGPPENKRQRTAGMYRRMRAIVACEPCRARKTKCDNIRPVCGFCQRSQGQCVYRDAGPSDYSGFDSATLAILDRVNHVVNLLEGTSSGVLTEPSQLAQPPSAHAGAASGCTPPSTQQGSKEDDLSCLDDPTLTAASTSCEYILRWPVFGAEYSQVTSFVFETEAADAGYASGHATGTSTLGRGVQEDDFIPLSKRFLAYVHIKNPILDIVDFQAMVREAAQNGAGWDGKSCLVLIACALGCLSSPFRRDPGEEDTPGSTRSLGAATLNQATASSYYLAARRRLGLLELSALQIQCFFFCAVFEMYSLRPLRAWHYFNLAAVNFRSLIWSQQQRGAIQSDEARRLEQRVYWSCLKSEFEIRLEIPLPPSGLAHVDFPALFPTPPREFASPAAPDESYYFATGDIEPEEERSWFYYLAEISYRRIMNRAIATMSRDGEAGWIRDVGPMIGHCEDFDEQIEVWSSHIPPQIDIANWEASTTELAHYVQHRAQAGREWIRRPFLYYMIHQPAGDPFLDRVRPLAEGCLGLCVKMMLDMVSHHRHHGTWYVIRTAAARAFIVLAAARSGRFQMPEGWMAAIDTAAKALERWAEEAPDFKQVAAILESLRRNNSPSAPPR
ncbi:vegetative cell wall protein gp1 [Thozetella sp. PMI_491]|nr:vegetative cell wall protein gp1 [Thozetella sp. PMI_491]